MNIGNSIAIIAVTALCTMMLRAVPFLLFGRGRKMPQSVRYLGAYLPPAIMATLIVYCLRNIDLTVGARGIPELLSVVLVAIVHYSKKNILLSVGLGTVCYMILVQMVFS